MEKLFIRLSFWLCFLCAVLAIITRVMNAWGLPASFFEGRANPIGYHSFMDGVLLFTMTSITAACLAYANRSGS
jgi:uncharacterized membrane protein YecN with MAPEG domain